MIIWPCRLNSSGSNGLMLWEEVWLVTLSELRLPINKEIYVVQRKRYGSGFFGLFIVVKGKNKK